MKNYGLKFDKFDPNHYFLGGGFLGTTEINPLGDWTQFVPLPEYQSRPTFDTQACTRYGTCVALEILFSFNLHEDRDFSKRFLSIVAGGSRTGDSPQNVADTAKNKGLIDEIDLPFDNSITTEDMFYSPNPMTKNFLNKAKVFLQNYQLDHEWVYPIGNTMTINDQKTLITQALKRSPIGASVSAWFDDGVGGFCQPVGMPENHWIAIIAEDDTYYHIYDSYDNVMKKYNKNSKITMAKLYTVRKITSDNKNNLFQIFINWILSIMNKQITTNSVKPSPTPVTGPEIKVGMFCLAIQKYEDYIMPGAKGRNGQVYPNGSLSYQNCNPGNLKYRTGMILAIGPDAHGFAKFGSYKDGFMCLKDKIVNAATGKSTVYSPTDTILTFFQKYAPSSDGNIPEKYAQFVADFLGVDISFTIQNLVV